jgi:hypothetical protein
MFQQMQSYTVQSQARNAQFAQAYTPFGGNMMMANNHHAAMVQQQMMVAQQQRMVMQNQAAMF